MKLASSIKFLQIEPEVCQYIDDTDKCFYLMDYHARKGYDYSVPNSFIFNFKKILNTPGQHHKAQAVNDIVNILCKLFNNVDKSKYVFVPMPTSKNKLDSDYDDRLIKVLDQLKNRIGINYEDVFTRELTIQPAHLSNSIRSPSMHSIIVDKNKLSNLTNHRIILFDDVVKTGSLYKACKTQLLQHTNCDIIGLFLAKTI